MYRASLSLHKRRTRYVPRVYYEHAMIRARNCFSAGKGSLHRWKILRSIGECVRPCNIGTVFTSFYVKWQGPLLFNPWRTHEKSLPTYASEFLSNSNFLLCPAFYTRTSCPTWSNINFGKFSILDFCRYLLSSDIWMKSDRPNYPI